MTSAVPYAADSTGVAATGAGLSLPPDPSMMGQQTGVPSGESPFGAAPVTTAPSQTQAPQPEPVAKSGGSGKIIGLGLAAQFRILFPIQNPYRTPNPIPNRSLLILFPTPFRPLIQIRSPRRTLNRLRRRLNRHWVKSGPNWHG